MARARDLSVFGNTPSCSGNFLLPPHLTSLVTPLADESAGHAVESFCALAVRARLHGYGVGHVHGAHTPLLLDGWWGRLDLVIRGSLVTTLS